MERSHLHPISTSVLVPFLFPLDEECGAEGVRHPVATGSSGSHVAEFLNGPLHGLKGSRVVVLNLPDAMTFNTVPHVIATSYL